MKHYKIGKWYSMFYIHAKHKIGGKTYYDIVDKFGEWLILNNEDLTKMVESCKKYNSGGK